MIPTTEQKILCAVSHLGTFAGFPFLAPLVVFFLAKDEFVKTQAKEAMVFQVVMLVLGIVGWALCLILIGFLILPILGIIALVLPIIAVIKNVDGVDFSYPVTGVFARSL